MNYFRNIDLTQLYGVSDKAVRNWIVNAQEGKSELELTRTKDGRHFITDNARNRLLITEMATNGRKYRNRRSYNEVYPLSLFYEQYTESQIFDIINNLEKYREIPSYYRYIGEGAAHWNEYLNFLYDSSERNLMNTTLELLHLDQIYFDRLLEDYERVNVIDIGVGNGLGAKKILEHLLTSGKLNKYIGIDCSDELLNLARSNISKWFKDRVTIETHLRDVTHERFGEIVSAASAEKNELKTINIFLFLGGTIGNFREPRQALSTIRDSMRKNDILVTSDELDSENARIFPGFSVHLASDKSVLTRNTLLLNLMGIAPTLYEVEQLFDEQIKCRMFRVKLKVELSLNIKVKSKEVKKITLRKGETITLFRMWEWTGPELTDIYENAGFSQIRTTRLHDPEYVLMLSRVNGAPATSPSIT